VVAVVFVACVAACLVAHVAILVSVLRGRAAELEPGVPRPRTAVEVVWALVPMLALAVVLTATWARARERAAPTPPEVMKVAR